MNCAKTQFCEVSTTDVSDSIFVVVDGGVVLILIAQLVFLLVPAALFYYLSLQWVF